jgi:hypothetical protein
MAIGDEQRCAAYAVLLTFGSMATFGMLVNPSGVGFGERLDRLRGSQAEGVWRTDELAEEMPEYDAQLRSVQDPLVGIFNGHPTTRPSTIPSTRPSDYQLSK